MIRYILLEWVLLCANFWGWGNKKGFSDKKYYYIKQGWLDWDIIERKYLIQGIRN